MNVTIQLRGGAVTEPMRERIAKKLGKLDRFFEDETEVSVLLSEERPARQIAEITVVIRDGTVLRVQEITSDLNASTDNAIDKIIRQLRKHRTKLEKRLRAGAFEGSQSQPGGEAAPQADEGSDELVRVKKFAMKPMAAEDAIAQMDLLGHSFFLFIEAASGDTCVVYRRHDGKVGMLQAVNG